MAQSSAYAPTKVIINKDLSLLIKEYGHPRTWATEDTAEKEPATLWDIISRQASPSK
jgi:hypothetical protein